MLEKAKENHKLIGLDHDYQETKPQLRVVIDRERAADLGVSIAHIGPNIRVDAWIALGDNLYARW